MKGIFSFLALILFTLLDTTQVLLPKISLPGILKTGIFLSMACPMHISVPALAMLSSINAALSLCLSSLSDYELL